MMAKLSDLAKQDIKSERLSLREYAKLYRVHHTTVLRVQKPRGKIDDGHKVGYYGEYHQRNREKRCSEERKRAERKCWALWLIRELRHNWPIITDESNAADAPTSVISSSVRCGKPTGRGTCASWSSMMPSAHGLTSRDDSSSPPSATARAVIHRTSRS